MIYLFLAPGFEEIEALGTVDILRRLGLDLQMVSLSEQLTVTGAHGVSVVADIPLSQVRPERAGAMVLPGGMPGAKNLDSCPQLRSLLLDVYERAGLLCAICAAPMVLGHLDLLQGRRATCYPGFQSELLGADYTAARVEEHGGIITAAGPGATAAFALAIARHFCAQADLDNLSEGMLLAGE